MAAGPAARSRSSLRIGREPIEGPGRCGGGVEGSLAVARKVHHERTLLEGRDERCLVREACGMGPHGRRSIADREREVPPRPRGAGAVGVVEQPGENRDSAHPPWRSRASADDRARSSVARDRLLSLGSTLAEGSLRRFAARVSSLVDVSAAGGPGPPRSATRPGAPAKRVWIPAPRALGDRFDPPVRLDPATQPGGVRVRPRVNRRRRGGRRRGRSRSRRSRRRSRRHEGPRRARTRSSVGPRAGTPSCRARSEDASP